MATQFSQPSIALGIICAIASTPFIFESLPGKTQTPATPTSSPIPSSTAVPAPNPEAIPTLAPSAAPTTPTPTTPASPGSTPTITPESEPTLAPASPGPTPTISPVGPTPTPSVSPTSTPTTPSPASTSPAAGNSLKQYSASSAPSLRVGSQGQAVRDVQTFLKEVGVYLGPIDGIYGVQTESAVKSFQESKNLTSDGVVGPQTWAVMLGS